MFLSSANYDFFQAATLKILKFTLLVAQLTRCSEVLNKYTHAHTHTPHTQMSEKAFCHFVVQTKREKYYTMLEENINVKFYIIFVFKSTHYRKTL